MEAGEEPAGNAYISPPAVAPADPIEDGKFVLADEKRLTEKVRQIMRAESFSGPTPHPKHLQQYEATLPGAAKIIFDQFQANAEHQRHIEERTMALQERAIELQARDNDAIAESDKRSQRYAAGLVVLGLGAAWLFLHMGERVVAGLVVGTLLISVLTGFLKGKLSRSESSDGKAPDTAAPTEEGKDS